MDQQQYSSDHLQTGLTPRHPRQAGPYPEAPRQDVRSERQKQSVSPVREHAPFLPQLEECLEDLLREW
jgi:hypothetical protein